MYRTSYCPQRDVHLPPEGWAQGQRQQIMLWRPNIWIFGLSRHSWQSNAHIKEIRGHSSPHSSKKPQKLRQFIGMINFYRDMWKNCSELLAPLTALTSKNVKYDWKDEHQKCFNAIKRVIGREVLLEYPDFNAPFEIHTDASKLQIGAVIYQKGNPIAFYLQNMNIAQHNYTTTDKELLSIVATLKEFRNILLGNQQTVYTDHKNTTHKFLIHNAQCAGA